MRYSEVKAWIRCDRCGCTETDLPDKVGRRAREKKADRLRRGWAQSAGEDFCPPCTRWRAINRSEETT